MNIFILLYMKTIVNKISSDYTRKLLLNNYKNDTSPYKINLLRGVYRDNNENPYILHSVRKAKEMISKYNHEYLDTFGDKEYINLTNNFIFNQHNNSLVSVQTLSGTGALHLGGKYLYDNMNTRIYIPNITWSNHEPIFKQIGFDVKTYPYYENHNLCIDKLLDFIKNIKNEVFLFHSCAHNPTGVDLNIEQWKNICDMVKKNNNTIFFDNAYQGFASGDYHQDAFAPRYFLNNNVNFLLAHSFSKNFGLYGERCGLLSLNLEEKKNIENELSNYIRTLYSNPPLNGSNIVKTILSNDILFNLWLEDCQNMSNRINEMRKQIGLDYIEKQIGMFGFLKLNIEQIDMLIHKYHIYLPYDGRISIAGLNSKNIDYFRECLYNILE